MTKAVLPQLIPFTAAAVLLLLYFFFPLTGMAFFPACFFHSITGLNCPGCGSQRALAAVLRGDIAQSLHYNLLFVISLPLVLYVTAALAWNAFNNKKYQPDFLYQPAFLKTTALLVILFWICRNIPVHPFPLLKA